MANIFTSAGEGMVVDILDSTIAVPTYRVGWGTGAGTAAKGDTTLFTEAAEARVATTQSQPTASQSRYVGTIVSASGQTITNAGILTAAAAGTLYLHSDFAGIPLLAGDSITFTFTVTWA